MLDTATFPLAGSLAQLDGETVRVHQLLGQTALVFGNHLTRRVDVAELAPPPEPTLFDRWRAERIVTPNDQARTLVADAFADYRDWLEAAGHAQSYPLTEHAFVRMMDQAGHRVTTGFWRNPGDKQARTRRLYRFALRKAGR